MTKKILTITTIAVLVTSIMTIAMINDAQADPKLDTSDFKCDKGFGSFFDPDLTDDIIYTGSWVDCSVIGSSGMAVAVEITGVAEKCAGVTIASPDGLDSFVINEKGFISFTTSGDQCFFDENGNTPTAAGFCVTGAVHTSILTGTYTITGGLIDGKPVVGGSGDTSSIVDHCAMDTAPYGNSGSTSFTGTIVLDVT